MQILIRVVIFLGIFLCVGVQTIHSQTTPAATAVISGVVSEERSGESVIGVTVVLSTDSTGKNEKNIVRGTRSNKFGFYSLQNIPLGSYILLVRGLGYKTFRRAVTIGTDFSPLKLNVQLASEAVRGKEVTVQADRESEQVSTRTISAVEISPELIKKLPALGGEVDVFRALQLMPGVKSSSEISSGLYVRGGSPDQNLNLLDGVPVYNPSHLGGLLSVFNNDALKDVKLIKGSFPAEYGGRLSSVVDIAMREGTKERVKGAAGLSIINAKLTLEGPIGEQGSFMLSGRRMYLDVLRAALSDSLRAQIPGYYFYDFNAKVNFNISENDKVFVSGYAGYDVLNQPDALDAKFAVTWGNATASARWTHIVSPVLFTNFSAMFTNYDFSTDISSFNDRGDAQGFSSLSRIRDWTARAEAQWFAAFNHTIKTGIEATYHTFRTAAETNAAFGAGAFRLDSTGGSTVESLEAAAFAQDEWERAFDVEHLNINAGVRLAYFQRGGYAMAEPRVSFSYSVPNATLNSVNSLVENINVKGAFAVANQFVHLIIRNDLGVPSDVWFPSTETVLPARAVQYALGVDAKLFDREFTASVEGYYKSFTNLYEFKDDAQFSLLTPLQDQFTRGTGEAYGVEIFVNKNGGRESVLLPKLTGWVGYTLAWAYRTFPDLNDGKAFFPRFDRRHDVSVVASYSIDESWEFGLSWVYSTGQAFTMPAAQFDFVALTSGSGKTPSGTPRPKFQSTERNGFRLPAFHKLDFSVTHRFTWLGLPFSASLSVYNLYNRANAFSWSIRYRTETQPDGSIVQRPYVQQLSLFPIIPTLSIGFTF